MSSPMIDTAGEHFPIPVDEDGNGPVDRIHTVKEVCSECGRDWPCESWVLIEDLREQLRNMAAKLRDTATEVYPNDIFQPLTGHDWTNIRKILHGSGYTLDRVSADILRRGLSVAASLVDGGSVPAPEGGSE